MKKLTVFLITNNYRPYSSGVANALDQLHMQLRKEGHQSHVVTLDFLGDDRHEDGVIRLYSPIRFMYKKNPMAIPLAPRRELANLIKKMKPDILHVHHPFLLGKIGLTLAKKFKIPIVFTYHTQYEKYLHYIPLPEKIMQPVVLKLVDDFCKKVDGIIVPTQSIKNALEQRITMPGPMTVIPSSIHPGYFSKKPKKLGKKPFHLITVSRFAKEKNIEFLLRAFKMLDQNSYKLTLLGYGQHEDFLKRYAYQTLSLAQENVKFVSRPSKEILRDFYGSADFFLFASCCETQGLVLAEAMASGTPVIAVDAPGSQDIIEHGKNGYLVKTERDMCGAIETLLKNTEHYAAFSSKALKTAQIYHSKVIIQSVLNCYHAHITVE